MIETPRGVLAAPAIAAASPRLECLVAGTSDLAKELHARATPGRAEVLTALSLVVLAARPTASPAWTASTSTSPTRPASRGSAGRGVTSASTGKTLIHPKTIAAANLAFAPGAEEIEAARRILVAHAEAESFGKGVVVVDGRLVEALHVEVARRLLALAEAVAARVLTES